VGKPPQQTPAAAIERHFVFLLIPTAQSKHGDKVRKEIILLRAGWEEQF